MARLVPLMDAKRRDAHVAAEWPARSKPLRMAAPNGAPVRLERFIRSTGNTTCEAIRHAHGDDAAVARALAQGDPEIDLALVGRRLGDAARVYVRQDGTLLATARMLTVVRGPDGAEKSRSEFVDVEPTVKEDGAPIAWTGRTISREEAIHKYAFTRKLQLLHISGLTFEFLFDMAKSLDETNHLALVGSGPKGQTPLVFTTNGAPYRGFLEGRVDGSRYQLILHLSNLELKDLGAEVGS
ncbi:MAG: hypothetical protein JW940_24380 [Polyangiaceae bacterium]|nr:hypothetical protein [Polyangiaceae bacterium]